MSPLDPTDAALVRSVVRDEGVRSAAQTLGVPPAELRGYLAAHPAQEGEWLT